MVRVEAVIAVHNRREITLRCLRDLLQNVDLNGIDLHIVVVDDGSTDGTSEAIAAEFPQVEIIKGDGELWYTGAMNRGIEAAMKHSPDYILGVNDDSEFATDFLFHLVELAESKKNAVVGALLLLDNGRETVFQVAPQFRISWGGMRHWYRQTTETIPEDPWEVEIIVGNCVLYPAKAIEQAGPMNEKQLPQYGDAEYTPRMRKLGWQLLIEPRARVFCKPNDVRESALKMSWRRFWKNVFVSSTSPQSMRRRFYMSLGPAPNKPAGVLAFLVFWIRFAAGRNMEGAWGQKQPEPTFKELYAGKTVKRH